MSVKRIFKGPWAYIVLAVVAVLLLLQFLAPGGGYDEVPTSRMQAYIEAGEVKEITFIRDQDQKIEATLDDGVRNEGAKVSSYYIDGQQDDAARGRRRAGRQRRDREVELGEPAARAFLGSILPTAIPLRS